MPSIRRKWSARTLAAAIVLAAVVAPVAANGAGVSPLVPFLLKPGDMSGFKPGKPQVFRTLGAVREASGEKPPKREIRRWEAEGFVEAAIARIRNTAEPAGVGNSSVFEFDTPAGAKTEMHVEVKEEFELKMPAATRKYFTRRRFGVPGVPGAVVYAFVSNRAAAKFGVGVGIAKGLFVEGNCLVTTGIGRFASREVTEPVIGGIQAIYRRTGGSCP
jgi:hypothetical protein